MDWCVKNYVNTNHNPVAQLNGDRNTDVLKITVTPGQTVNLSANGSGDPDGDTLSYRWWEYEEADSYEGVIGISGSTSKNARFKAPSVSSSKTIHIILEVIDDGKPNLISYRRLVVTVNPRSKP